MFELMSDFSHDKLMGKFSHDISNSMGAVIIIGTGVEEFRDSGAL